MSIRRFLPFAAAFWTVFGLLAGTQVWISMMSHGHSIPWLLSYYLIVWLAWLGPTALIVWLAQRYPVLPLRPVSVVVHALAATAIAIAHSLFEMSLMLWMRPYDRMTAQLSELAVGEILLSRLMLEWILYGLVLGGVLAFEYYQRYHERALQAAQLQRSLVDARLHALELQLQPHFLFNTLNAIAGLMRIQQRDEAITMIAGLADLLRYSLDHAGRQQVALEEEIEMLRRYLEIEGSHFPDRMAFHIALADDAGRAAVPLLVLQPLAENAVRHGIASSASPGRIEVDARRVDDRLRISMRNTGSLGSTPIEGIGLKNTRERLATLHGDAARITLAMDQGEVLATLELPWNPCE